MCKKQLRLDLKSPNMKINTKRALLSNSILYDSCALSYQPIFKNRSPCRHSVVILVDQANPVILKHQCCIPRSVIGSYFGLIITLIIFFLSSKSRWQNKTWCANILYLYKCLNLKMSLELLSAHSELRTQTSLKFAVHTFIDLDSEV